MTAVFEHVTFYPDHIVGAWIASFSMVFNGLCHDYHFACGMLDLTEKDARGIMEVRNLLHEARSLFLHYVDLKKESVH